MEKEDLGIQLVDPHNHWVNVAKRVVQTFKNLFPLGLGTVKRDFPLMLWIKMIKKYQDSLILLLTLQHNPELSAYIVLEGAHDFNKVL